MVKIVIPARKGSKGLPHKNVKLFESTAGIIPKSVSGKGVIVTTDDEQIETMAAMHRFDVIQRSAKLSSDDADMRSVLENVIENQCIFNDEIIIMLYLTYPERTWEDVQNALDWFIKVDAKSMLCRQPVKTDPYLCMLEDGFKGRQMVPHDYYRRQDYPKVFEISHFIFIALAGEIYNLNKNLYNADTMFYDIDRVHDIDTGEDLKKYEKSTCNITG